MLAYVEVLYTAWAMAAFQAKIEHLEEEIKLYKKLRAKKRDTINSYG